MKKEANLECGWGGTYATDDWQNTDAALWGRVNVELTGAQVQNPNEACCEIAVGLDGATRAEGGRAVRFGVLNGRCIVDREKFLGGNLDMSSGRAIMHTDPCGDETDVMFWRHAAGAADASNLQSGGRCVPSGGFERLVGENATVPRGRLPDSNSWELPNSNCDEDSTNNCGKMMKFNTISDAEECCEMCRTGSWLGDGKLGGDDDFTTNPCLAWQIVDGKCRIMRKEWVDSAYGSTGLGLHAEGDVVMGIQEVVEACTTDGVAGDACLRADDSHGHWAGCSNEDDAGVEDNCDYYSFMYWRTVAAAAADTGGDTADASYRKITTVDVNVDGLDGGDQAFAMNTSVHLYATRDRDIDSGERPTAAKDVAPTHVSDGQCARVEIYAPEDVIATFGGNTTVFDEETSATPLCTSAPVCTDGTIVLSCTADEISGPNRRRALLTTDVGAGLIVSYTAVGTGYDTVDFSSASATSLDGDIVDSPSPGDDDDATPPEDDDATPPAGGYGNEPTGSYGGAYGEGSSGPDAEKGPTTTPTTPVPGPVDEPVDDNDEVEFENPVDPSDDGEADYSPPPLAVASPPPPAVLKVVSATTELTVTDVGEFDLAAAKADLIEGISTAAGGADIEVTVEIVVVTSYTVNGEDCDALKEAAVEALRTSLEDELGAAGFTMSGICSEVASDRRLMQVGQKEIELTTTFDESGQASADALMEHDATPALAEALGVDASSIVAVAPTVTVAMAWIATITDTTAAALDDDALSEAVNTAIDEVAVTAGATAETSEVAINTPSAAINSPPPPADLSTEDDTVAPPEDDSLPAPVEDEDGGTDNTGAIVGGVFGGVAVLGGVGFFVVKSRANKKELDVYVDQDVV